MSDLLPCKHSRPLAQTGRNKRSAKNSKGKRVLRLLQALLVYACCGTGSAADTRPVNQYHFVLEQGKYNNKAGKIITHYKYFDFGPNEAHGYVRVSYWPKDSLWLNIKYPRLKKINGESLYSKFPIWNQAWISGPRRGFDIYLGKNKSVSLSTSINVFEASLLLPALTRRIKVDHDAYNDIKQITIDVDPAIPINHRDDARVNRAAWMPPPYYVQNPDKTYPDQARISIGDDYQSLRIVPSCLASDAIGKIKKMEVLMISPIEDARLSPVSLAVLDFNEPVYNMEVILEVGNKVKLAEDQEVGKGGHTFRVTCTTTKGESLIKEALFAFPPPPIRPY